MYSSFLLSRYFSRVSLSRQSREAIREVAKAMNSSWTMSLVLVLKQAARKARVAAIRMQKNSRLPVRWYCRKICHRDRVAGEKW